MARCRRRAAALLPDSELEPVDEPARASRSLPSAPDATALERAVVIKLNGGLGTSMGMTRAEVAARGRATA